MLNINKIKKEQAGQSYNTDYKSISTLIHCYLLNTEQEILTKEKILKSNHKLH